MSKRARITLEPEATTDSGGESPSETAAASQADVESTVDAPFTTADSPMSAAAVATRWLAQNRGTLIKVLIAGLAVASVAILLKNRKF